jgi:hypothetical protein
MIQTARVIFSFIADHVSAGFGKQRCLKASRGLGVQM